MTRGTNVVVGKESCEPTTNCHPERWPSPALRDEGESKDPEGVSSAMRPQGVRSILRENALMLYLTLSAFPGYLRWAPSLRSGFRLRALTLATRLNFDIAPVCVVWERIRWRYAQDDSHKVVCF